MCDGCEDAYDTIATPAGNFCVACYWHWLKEQANLAQELTVDFANKMLYN